MADEYQIVLSQERRVFQIPENNKYIFYVYLENGMCLPVTRFLGVSREIPMENEEKGIIQI